MITIEKLLKTLESVGYINLGDFPTKRRQYIQTIYNVLQLASCFLFLCSQSFSTMTRSIRYMPEFFQRLTEIVVSVEYVIVIFYLASQPKRLNSLVKFERKVFIFSDDKIRQKCKKLGKSMYLTVFSIIAGAMIAIYLETFLYLPESELEIRSYVYRTEHPERTHSHEIRFPFIDETTSHVYTVTVAWLAFLDFTFVFGAIAIINLIPIASFNLRAQYEILAKYLSQIGYQQENDNENMVSCSKTGLNTNRNNSYENIAKLRAKRDQNLLKKIIKFHKQLIQFQVEVNF